MSGLIDTLNHNANVLYDRGRHTRALTNLSKLGGVVAISLGVAGGAIGGDIESAVIAGVGGAALYTGAIAKEYSTTGKVMPFPYFYNGAMAIMKSATATGVPDREITEVDYLTREERAQLLLATTFRPSTLALNNLPAGEQGVVYSSLVNGIQHVAKPAIDHPARAGRYVHAANGIEAVHGRLTAYVPPAYVDAFAEPVAPPMPELPTSRTELRLRSVTPKPETVAEAVEPLKSAAYTAPQNIGKRRTTPVDLTPKTAVVTAIETILKAPYESRMWLGGQRTGKSYLAAVASRRLNDTRGVTVFQINLASFGDEDSYYWRHVKSENRVCVDISEMDTATATHYVEQAVDLVHKFYATDNALLIFDEFAYAGSATNNHTVVLGELIKVTADKISTLASTGVKRRKALWALAPEFVAGGYIKDALSVKKLSLVFCAIPPGRSAVWRDPYGAEHRITFDQELFDAATRNFKSLKSAPVNFQSDRVVAVNGRWMAPGVNGSELSPEKST